MLATRGRLTVFFTTRVNLSISKGRLLRGPFARAEPTHSSLNFRKFLLGTTVLHGRYFYN